MTLYNTNVDLVTDNEFTKFCQIPSTHCEYIEQKPNSGINKFWLNSVLSHNIICIKNLVKLCQLIAKILSKKLILASIKGRNSCAKDRSL